MSAPRAPTALLALALLAGCAGLVPGPGMTVDIDRIGIEYAPARIRGVLDDLGCQPVQFKDNTSQDWTYVQRDAQFIQFRCRLPASDSIMAVKIDNSNAEIRLTVLQSNPGVTKDMANLRRALVHEYGARRVH